MDKDGNVIIRAEGLAKSFGHTRALKGIDLTVRSGDFWLIFGPNGAGKSTLIGILATLLKQTKGQLTIDGIHSGNDIVELRRKIGVISHQTFLYGDLTAYENLSFYGRLYGIDNLKTKVTGMLAEMGLADWADERVRNFSRGMQQRLTIARALLHGPSILLLDEPGTGLDQHAMRHFYHLLGDLHSQEQTILMTSHNLTIGLEKCTHLAILAGGRIVFSAQKSELDGKNFEEIYFYYTEKERK